VVHACVDVETGVMLAWVITTGHGKGTGHVSAGPERICRAAEVIGAVLADRAYDARSCWEAAREWGRAGDRAQEKAVYGLDADRSTALHQIGKVGPPEWKRRRGHHGRSLVASLLGALKKTLGERLVSKRWDNREAEEVVRVRVLNR
jgi:hypothetical protein